MFHMIHGPLQSFTNICLQIQEDEDHVQSTDIVSSI